MKSKFFFLLLLTSSVLAMAASCPLQNPDLSSPRSKAQAKIPPAELKLIQDERYGYTLTVPKDWTVTRRDTNPVLFALAPNATSYGPLANVVLEDINQRMAAFDYLEANILTMRISLPNLKIKRGGVEMIGGLTIAWIQYTYPRGQIQLEAISFCQTKDYRAYVVTTLAPAFMFKDNESLFRLIGRSLRVGEIQPVK